VDVFLFMFNLANAQSLMEMAQRWMSQVIKYNANNPAEDFVPAKWILIGTKDDLRETQTDDSWRVVSTKEGVAFAKKHHMEAYVETSSQNGLNVDLAIFTGLIAAVEPESSIRNNNKCVIF
jgi:hypothetical protein